MAHRKAVTTQAEILRVLKAVRDAGFPVSRVEVLPNGSITVSTTADPAGDVANDWDRP